MPETKVTAPRIDDAGVLVVSDRTVTTIGTVVVPRPRVAVSEVCPDDDLGTAEHPGFGFDVALVGLGYVGLPTALSFHAAGRAVLGLDVSRDRRAAIFSQSVDLLESDQQRLSDALASPSGFDITGDADRLREAAAVIIAVPTPVDSHLLPDLAILRAACATVVEQAVKGQVIILTSTTYVGSTVDLLVGPLEVRGLKVGRDVHVAFSPERIDPGNDRHAHEDVPRVIGGVTPGCAESAAGVLRGYAENLHMVSSPQVAEMTKLWENTFRAINIAYANEMSEVCRELDIDVREVIQAAATKPYGFMPFFPGPGVGGHCIPCDPHYLLWQLRGGRTRAPLVTEAMMAIAARPHRVVDRVREVLCSGGVGIGGARIVVAGIAYKPNVQDVRESPALDIMEELRALGAQVSFHDPVVGSIRGSAGIRECSVELDELAEADLVLVHTLHSCVDPEALMGARLVLDTTYRLPDAAHRHLL